MEDYYRKFEHLLRVDFPKYLKGSDTPLLRAFSINSFNRSFCELDTPSNNPLASVEYNPTRENTILTHDIADSMMLLPWKEHFGLDFEQVISLPYDEWEMLTARLLKHLEKNPVSDLQHLRRESVETNELLKQLLVELRYARTGQLPKGLLENDPSGRNRPNHL